MRIDAHQHFWLYDERKDSWITDEMAKIRRNFLPNDIGQILKDNNFDGVVAVQADQSHRETEFLVELSSVYKLIKGIVGWVDLASDAIHDHLSNFSKYPVIKGFRHIVESEQDGNFLMRPKIQRGLKALASFGFTFDLLISPIHYESTLRCVQSNPDLNFMLDHIAKPSIKTGELEEWSRFIVQLSTFPNVYCKISGLATEADWNSWEIDDFAACIDHAITCFGRDRVCFGSDWPVCLLAADFESSIAIAQSKVKNFSTSEQENFWGNVASRFYNLK